MSDVAPVAAPVAPTNGAHPTTPQKPAEAVKPAPVKAAEVDDTEEYTVDGKTVKLNKEQRKLQFQKALAADKRLKEAADLKNQHADLQKLIDTDFDEFLRKTGKDPEKFYAERLERKAKDALLTEEQRAIKAADDRAKAAEEKAAKYEAEQKKAKQAELDQRNFKALEHQLVEAATAHNLDQSPDVLAAMCDIAIEYLDLDIALTADQVATEYLRREREHLEQKDKKLHSVLKGKKLLDYLGASTLAEVKAALALMDAESLNGIPKPQAKPKIPVRAHERTPTAKTPYMSEAEFDKLHRR